MNLNPLNLRERLHNQFFSIPRNRLTFSGPVRPSEAASLSGEHRHLQFPSWYKLSANITRTLSLPLNSSSSLTCLLPVSSPLRARCRTLTASPLSSLNKALTITPNFPSPGEVTTTHPPQAVARTSQLMALIIYLPGPCTLCMTARVKHVLLRLPMQLCTTLRMPPLKLSSFSTSPPRSALTEAKPSHP